MQGLVIGLRPSAPAGTAWLQKGFRPFFLAAGAHAVLMVPAWIAILLGAPWPHAGLSPLDWHAHEMVFGFAGAVMAGFLLTAICNWTGRTTLEGGPLGALLALWIGARLAPCVPGVGGVAAAALESAFWLVLTVACARPILAARSKRNYGFLLMLSGLWLASSLSHASRLGVSGVPAGLGRTLGVDLLVIAILVMTSRIVPMFTRNATAATDIASHPALDRAAIAAAALLAVLDVSGAPLTVRAVLSIFAGAVTLLRARDWGARRTLGRPLLWSLHLGNAWLGAGLMLRGLSAFVPALPAGAALHAITAGGIGLTCLGMMTRVTLGHTGRVLAVPWRIVWGMRALSLAVLLRVLGPVVAPSYTNAALALAATLWSLAFLSFLLVYGKALVARRVDGKPG